MSLKVGCPVGTTVGVLNGTCCVELVCRKKCDWYFSFRSVNCFSLQENG